MKMTKKGWKIKERVGITIVNPILYLPEEERKKVLEEKVRKAKEYYKTGEPANNPPYVCPNGCDGPFRKHGTTTTMVGYGSGPDPNHWKESCSCESCGERFTKEWVPAKNDGKPWFVKGETWEDRVVYSGKCMCCCPKKGNE
jgi:hypothetical protein